MQTYLIVAIVFGVIGVVLFVWGLKYYFDVLNMEKMLSKQTVSTSEELNKPGAALPGVLQSMFVSKDILIKKEATEKLSAKLRWAALVPALVGVSILLMNI